jgi:Tol biopolymer transport system component
VTVSGAVVTYLTNNTVTDDYPTWSPDGSKLAFESDRDGDFEIYLMNPNGTGVTRLTNNTVFDGQPAWGTLRAAPHGLPPSPRVSSLDGCRIAP